MVTAMRVLPTVGTKDKLMKFITPLCERGRNELRQILINLLQQTAFTKYHNSKKVPLTVMMKQATGSKLSTADRLSITVSRALKSCCRRSA